MTGTPNNLTDEARAALWRKMLAVAKHLREQSPAPATLSQSSPIVPMRQGNGEVPVYWIEPDLDEFKIAQSITANSPIYAVEIRHPSAWYDLAAKNETKGLPTVEQIAASYVTAIKAHGNFSRCILGGHSFGGIIAFEAARQFALLNIQVDMVLLLDTAAIYPSSHQAAWQKLKQIWSPANDMSTIDRSTNSLWTIRWLLGFKWRGLANLFIGALTHPPERLTTRLDDTGKPLTWPQIQFVYDTAMSSYPVSQVDCRGVLFRAESKQDDAGSRSLETHLGWDDLFQKGLEIVRVLGGHVSMLREPHADMLAREMSRILSAIPEEHEKREAAAATS
jgi:thioesterase domain-containing protein